ncbi:MAG: [protein-PII] uridylyltransferase [Deltaproteobacteria bacterium]|nr:[protein-PII] uridylyltransferase [Deltaproteobacteria bacterium]
MIETDTPPPVETFAIPLPPLPPADLDIEADPQFNLRALSKDYRARVYSELEKQQLAGASGTTLVSLHTRLIDRLIQYLFAAATQLYTRRNPRLHQRCVVFAQGGYGRGELNPYSDIDLLFLYHWKITPYVETICDTLYYSLLDAGFIVGHAVRNVRECVALASRDLQVKTALLDHRFLCGDEQLMHEFTTATEREIVAKNSERFFQEKAQESQERHRRHGDSIYMLEPHIKEGKGGLRDLHTAGWLVKVKFKVRTLRELVPKGIVTAAQLDEVEAARDFLWHVRNSLHLLEHTEQDVLTFERQEALAPRLGFTDVASFMHEYYRHATTISAFSRLMQDRCVTTSRLSSFLGRVRGREIREGVRIAENVLSITKPEILSREPVNLVTLFHDAQRHGVQLANDSQQLIRDTVPKLPVALGESPPLRTALFTILAWKQRVSPTLNIMHDLGVLDWLLPELGRLHWRTQRELYHVYTVDAHSLQGVAEIELLRDGAYKATHPLLTQVVREVDKIELLFLAILYHDVGKGYGHDHDERGAAMVKDTAARWNLSPDDTHEWHFLVQHHLRMSSISQRQDLSDEAVITNCARFVETPALLKKLYLLTFADMKAVGPKVWNPWKGELLDELYLRTLEVLETGEPVEENREARLQRRKERLLHALTPLGSPTAVSAFLSAAPENYLLSTPEEAIPRHFELVHRFLRQNGSGEPEPYRATLTHFPEREFSELTIVTRDRPGLFAMLTGVLSSAGLNIAGARISTSEEGLALDVFQLSHADRKEVVMDADTWTHIYSRLAEVLNGKRTLDDLLRATRAPSFLHNKQSRYGTDVTVDNETSPDYTVIDITGPDRMGFLFTITYTLFALDLEIHVAKITTNVDHVLDIFYVTDRHGAKVSHPDHITERIRQRLLGTNGGTR